MILKIDQAGFEKSRLYAQVLRYRQQASWNWRWISAHHICENYAKEGPFGAAEHVKGSSESIVNLWADRTLHMTILFCMILLVADICLQTVSRLCKLLIVLFCLFVL